MELLIIIALVFVAAFFLVRMSKEYRRKREEEEAKKRRADAIYRAQDEAEDLVKRGAIFEITTTSGIRDYHVKELGWVRCECDERSDAEKRLRIMAADTYTTANALTKLSYNFRDERYQAGTGPKGNPYYRNQKVKTWEAMACEAIPNLRVDKSPIRWNHRLAVIDGSNVAHWGDDGFADLDAVKSIVHILKKDGSTPIVIFDANIGFKVADKHMSVEELVKVLGGDVEVEIVKSGTVADRRIVELAEQRKAIIVSNDLFRDSLRARPIPKRRGFFLPKYNYAELLDPRT